MVLIKRYPNRKLYDTVAKQYISLAGVEQLVHQGAEIKVIDNSSGEDLTAFTLAQIILGQGRKREGFPAHSFLADWMRNSGERFSGLMTNLRATGYFVRQIDEEIKIRLQNLSNAGELSEKEAAQLAEKLSSPAATQANESRLKLELPQQMLQQSLQQSLQDIEALLSKNRIPTHDDFQRLNNQIDDLSRKLAEISDKDL